MHGAQLNRDLTSIPFSVYHFMEKFEQQFAVMWLSTVINQLVFRSHDNLQQFVDDRDLFIRVVGEIMTEFNMQHFHINRG